MLPAVPDYTTLVTGDNKVYVMGGLLGGGVGMLPLNESVQVFDPGGGCGVKNFSLQLTFLFLSNV